MLEEGWVESLSLEITLTCNLKCSYCCSPSERNVVQPLTQAELLRIVEESIYLGCKAIEITGGEPFLDLSTVALILKLAEGIQRTILTNGVLLRREDVQDLLYETEAIRVSLDEIQGPSKFRIGSKPEEIIHNIKKTRELHSDLSITINTLANYYNVNEFLDFYDLLKELDIDKWAIGFTSRRGRAENYFSNFRPASFKSVGTAATKLVKRYLEDGCPFVLDVVHLFYSDDLCSELRLPKILPTEHPCTYIQNKLFINYGGDIIFCPELDFPLTNIRRYQTLKDAIVASRNHTFLSIKMEDVGGCKSCRYYQLCGTGCRGNALHLFDSLNEPDPIMCSFWPIREAYIFPLLTDKVRKAYQSFIDYEGTKPKCFDDIGQILTA